MSTHEFIVYMVDKQYLYNIKSIYNGISRPCRVGQALGCAGDQPPTRNRYTPGPSPLCDANTRAGRQNRVK